MTCKWCGEEIEVNPQWGSGGAYTFINTTISYCDYGPYGISPVDKKTLGNWHEPSESSLITQILTRYDKM